MKKIVLALVMFLLISCHFKVSKEDVSKLNGYWEIEKAVLPDGTKKEYKINETIDYFDVKNNVGFRKKVMPQLDGTYLVNDQQEKIKIIEKDTKFFIEYTTSYAKWKEEIIEISNDNLVLKNERNLEYHYKKPTPFSLK
jgi:hypothetical protein